MNELFDAYQQWLDIPPEEQPADHYRLLGLQRFENDPDAIAAAADDRMATIRTYHLGARADHSQRILNELATAKTCLLDNELRAAYDATLRTNPDVVPPPLPTEIVPPSQQPTPPPISPREAVSTVSKVNRRSGTRRKRRTSTQGSFFLIVLAVLGLLAVIFVVVRRKENRRSPTAEMLSMELPSANGREDLAGKTVTVPEGIMIQEEDGSVVLPAQHARVSGRAVTLNQGAISKWSPDGEAVQWEFLITQPGIFMVEVNYAADRDSAGGIADITVNHQTVPFHIRDTGGWQEFVTDETKMVRIPQGGRYTLSMVAAGMPSETLAFVMSVRLRQAKTKTNR